jgi:predicted TIM-barrel fold metal-dependent hydrolase
MSSAEGALSARRIDQSKLDTDSLPPLLVSADSHVDEPMDLWKGVKSSLRDQMPPRRPMKGRPAGAMDPKLRVADMELDGVAAEILYPSACLWCFGLPQDVQEAIFPVYNDWVADYCKAAPDRLFGITVLPCYDIDAAVKELHRGYDMGLRGAMIWRAPDPRLPFTDLKHYEKLWGAAAELGQPINLHTLTNHGNRQLEARGMERARSAVNTTLHDGITTMFDLIWSGVCDRHPKLRFEYVEAEIGWLPFVLQQWDYYFERYTKTGTPVERQEFLIQRKPSEVFAEHFFATFLDDYAGSRALTYWGERNCMWSSDYPHPSMTWPNSRAFIAKNLGDLPLEKKKRLLSQNVIDLYGLPL